jgi:hypothetical protein
MKTLTVLTIVSALAFLYYGLIILFSPRLKAEFKRLGKSKFRPLIGALQIAGACGLAVGLVSPVIGVLAAFGIATLMLLGVYIRVRNRDSILQTMPAFFYLCMNAYICVLFYNTI